jgi:hypothetical protein
VLTVRVALAVGTWTGVVLIQGALLAIARFFERHADKRTYYQAYLLPMALTLVGAGRYVWAMVAQVPRPDFIGDPLANLCLFGSGLLVIALGVRLYRQMIEDAPQ